MDSTIAKMIGEEFIWIPQKGMGHFPVKEFSVYDEAYFEKYRKYENTPMGKKLTAERIGFVARFYSGTLTDVGIGSGHFLMNRPDTWGFDINPKGVKFLKDKNLYVNPYMSDNISAASFWDSLEHLSNPSDLLRRIREWVFTSLPIFLDCAHVLRSKHFRKDEHIHYWTRDGFIGWMGDQGFVLKGQDRFEIKLGREDIETFAFQRKK